VYLQFFPFSIIEEFLKTTDLTFNMFITDAFENKKCNDKRTRIAQG
jgi:hypothetical protein